MTDRRITLAFDGERNQSESVNSGIPQGSPISSILFLIYIRYLFVKINKNHLHLNLSFKLSSYIDDVIITVEEKTAEKNSQILMKIIKTTFQ